MAPAHGAGDHAPVPGHPVLAVDHIARRAPGRRRSRRRGAGPGAGLAMRAAASGDVGLGQDGHPGAGKDEAPVDRGHHDPGAGSGQPDPCRPGPSSIAGTDRDGEPFLGQHAGQPLGRGRALGAEHDGVAGLDQAADLLGELGPVAEDGLPTRGSRCWGRPATLGRGDQGDHAGSRCSAEQAVEGHVEAGCAVTGLQSPGRWPVPRPAPLPRPAARRPGPGPGGARPAPPGRRPRAGR